MLLFGCGQVKTLPPLERARIGTMVGSVNELMVPELFPQAQIYRFNNYVDASAALLANKIDYAIMDYATAWNFAHSSGAYAILPEKLSEDVSAVAYRKDDRELNEKIDAVLREFLEDGTMDEIIARWFREDGSAYDPVEVPKFEDAPVLRLAITTLREPRCFIRDGVITGMEVEMMDRVAYQLGMRTEYQDMAFAAMIDSLQSGKSDAIVGLYETPERARQVNFTVGYFANPQVVLMNKERWETTGG